MEAAATIPPVGAYVRALSVRSERTTASRHSPSYRQRDDQSRQVCSVCATAQRGSSGGGGRSFDGCQVSENGTDWPSRTVNSAYVAKSRPSSWTSVLSSSASGPAIADRPVVVRRTHGTTEP